MDKRLTIKELIKNLGITKESFENIYNKHTYEEVKHIFNISGKVAIELLKEFKPKLKVDLNNSLYMQYCPICGKLFRAEEKFRFDVCSEICEYERKKQYKAKMAQTKFNYATNEFNEINAIRLNSTYMILEETEEVKLARKEFFNNVKNKGLENILNPVESTFLFDLEARRNMVINFKDIYGSIIYISNFINYYKLFNIAHLVKDLLNQDLLFKGEEIKINYVLEEELLEEFIDTKEELEKQIEKVGFIKNTKSFYDTKMIPDFINETEKIILDYNTIFWNKEKTFWSKYRFIWKDFADVARKRLIYESFGYKYLVAWEDSIKPFETLKELFSLYSPIKHVFYNAGGWFSPAMDKALNEMHMVCDDLGIKVFKPKEDGTTTVSELKQKFEGITSYDWLMVFKDNIEAIAQAKAILASTTENDSGTLIEVGIAFQMGIPVYAYQPADNGKLNTMLVQSATQVFTSRDDLYNWLNENIFVDKKIENF